MITYQNQEKTYNVVKCSSCGNETQIPFEALEGREIYCRECFKKKE